MIKNNQNPWYEDDIFTEFCPHYPKMHDVIAKAISSHIPLSKEKRQLRILEIGCGSGYTTETIINSVDEMSLDIVDVDEKAIEFTSTRLGAHRRPKTTLVNVDALNFLSSTSDNEYDIIVSAFTTHNFTQRYRQEFLIETLRCLTKGGVFINADKIAANSKDHTEAFIWQTKRFFDVAKKYNDFQLLEKWVVHYLEDEGEDFKMIETEYLHQLKEVGYSSNTVLFREKLETVIISS